MFVTIRQNKTFISIIYTSNDDTHNVHTQDLEVKLPVTTRACLDLSPYTRPALCTCQSLTNRRSAKSTGTGGYPAWRWGQGLALGRTCCRFEVYPFEIRRVRVS